MKTVFQMFWRICLLRQSPAYVPTESWFVAVVIAANLLVSIVVSSSIGGAGDVLTVATRIVVGQAVYASLVWLATYLREFPGRFAGTVTALFGCDLIITAAFGVLMPMARALGDLAMNLLSLGFMIWSLAVAGFILAQALSVRMGIGILLALGMTVLTVAAGATAVGA
ncbi:MAG: hypothetical protein PVH91_09170 [Pseudomonadales bacterium]